MELRGPATVRAREILELERGTAEYYVDSLVGDGPETLDQINSLDGLRELVANLIVRHLRISGKLDTVSRETVEVAGVGGDRPQCSVAMS